MNSPDPIDQLRDGVLQRFNADMAEEEALRRRVDPAEEEAAIMRDFRSFLKAVAITVAVSSIAALIAIALHKILQKETKATKRLPADAAGDRTRPPLFSSFASVQIRKS